MKAIHTVIISLLAIGFGAVIILAFRKPAQPPAAQEHSRGGSRAPISDEAAADPVQLAQKAKLEAEVRDLQARVNELRSDRDGDATSINIPKAFFEFHGVFSSPFIEGDTGVKLQALLQMDEAEIEAVDRAVETAMSEVREFELANLKVEAGPDGHPIFIVPPMGDAVAAGLRAEAEKVLGSERGGHYFENYLQKELLGTPEEGLNIKAQPKGGELSAYLQVRRINPETGTTGSDEMFWLKDNNPKVEKFVERYGHLLGVGSDDELKKLVEGYSQ